jgi:hypothetical protein
LILKGADPAIKSKDGESTLDCAKKFSYPPVLRALGVPEPRAAANPVFFPAAGGKGSSSKQAVEKSIALLQRTSASFFTEDGCVACHRKNLTGIAVSTAHRYGFKVDEARASEEIKSVRLQWASFEQPLLQRGSRVEVPEIAAYSLLPLAAENATPDRAKDAMIHNVSAMQRQDGNWHSGLTAGPPP